MSTPPPTPPRTRAQARGDQHAAPFLAPDGTWAVGLTVREAFALAALQGFIAAQETGTYSEDARAAVAAADALLAVLHPEPIHPEGKGDGFRRVCHVCHGAKKEPDEDGQREPEPCSACGSSGVLEIGDTDAEADTWIPCPACKGEAHTTNARGKVVDCKPCEGTGYKYPTPET